VSSYISYDENYLDKGNCVFIGGKTFEVSYQEKDFYSNDSHNLVLYLKNNEKKSKACQLFLASCINKSLGHKYSWGDSISNRKIQKDKIQLPTKNKKIDFDFMESFIAQIEEERIEKLEAYLEVSGLKDYTLTEEEEEVLEDFENIKWEEFNIDNLFEKLNLKTLKKPFDKLTDTSRVKTDEFNLPLINAKMGDNGIMFYGREKDFNSAQMTIDVISNGAIATGTVYAQPYKTGVLWDAYLLRPKVVNISKEKLLFLTTSLEKSIKTKFGWDNKAVWSKVQHEVISLPTQNKKPDYKIMETLISAIQKLVIKDVVEYVGNK